MPKEFFNIRHVTALSAIPHGSAIHFIGVCGVAMAQLAVELAHSGYRVSGSDKEFYEPMGTLLRGSPVRLSEGYAGSNVPGDVALVVIGNAISYGHPEVAVVEERGLPYTLFPQVLHDHLIAGRHSIVVTGTHGKTTTTALIASSLNKLNADPSYFIGGICEDLPESLRRGNGRLSVVEGDEYDSAFFAKVPKFDFYAPDTCIINAVEFDHADIYPDLTSINAVFEKMVRRLTAQGALLVCADGENVRARLSEWRSYCQAPILTFGEHALSDARIVARHTDEAGQRVSVQYGARLLELAIPLIGAFNARNALVTFLALERNGFAEADILRALSTYRAVKRRQEIRFSSDEVVLMEDFAHHPTAIGETLRAVRERFPNRKITAVFEPRSNTSRKKVFFEEYLSVFAAADEVFLTTPVIRPGEATDDLLDVAVLAQTLSQSGVQTHGLPSAQAIADVLLSRSANGEVQVVMSNGSFGGLIELLRAGYQARYR